MHLNLLIKGLFKQAKEGDCNKPKPNLFDVVEAKKWFDSLIILKFSWNYIKILGMLGSQDRE